ncbi:hypothetical protein RchiOBHm_Chr3g0492611 [Rosa chinensis]|uniref:Uncharacterized protein n=1 Tax=Rosa chinensis TaxID=74649 RepID=A0A2P6RGJ2_ROSCH|nr:hypothetical protein RchiOBHm_Chr3g0492611 [Rosa chinensis]
MTVLPFSFHQLQGATRILWCSNRKRKKRIWFRQHSICGFGGFGESEDCRFSFSSAIGSW